MKKYETLLSYQNNNVINLSSEATGSFVIHLERGALFPCIEVFPSEIIGKSFQEFVVDPSEVPFSSPTSFILAPPICCSKSQLYCLPKRWIRFVFSCRYKNLNTYESFGVVRIHSGTNMLSWLHRRGYCREGFRDFR